jgi:hypothetical protein
VLKRHPRAAALFAFLVLIGIAGTYGWILYIESCSQQRSTEKSIEKKSGAEADQSTTQYLSPPPYRLHATQQADGSPQKNNAQNPSSILSEPSFFCDAVPSDVFLVLLTYCLVVVGGFQAWWLWKTVKATEDVGGLTRESIELARKEFITTHRPRIRVRSVQFTGPRDLSRHDANIWIANVGEGTAKEIGLESFGARKQRGAWIDGNKPILGTAIAPRVCNDLAPGAPVVFGGSFPPPMDKEARGCVRNGMEILYFMGLIRYSDDNGIVRHTGFCWQYDHRTGDFVMPEKDDEYNYED